LDEYGSVIRNKDRLVAQGYDQQEGVDFDETYALVTRLESIRMQLAFASAKDFKLYQMDVKSAFLNGYIKEEVYVHQPPGFEDPTHPEHVYKLNKALYGLKQAPRAWYDRLRTFLLQHDFRIGVVDSTLFVKEGNDILLVQIYVDDIIFGSNKESLCQHFCETMKTEFEMSMMGELRFFLGLQIQQLDTGIYISQTKYVLEILKKFDFENVNGKETPIALSTSLGEDLSGKRVDEKKYQGMIGSLLYLTASRPDILFATCLCARFQSEPKESHFNAVKRIFRYLNSTKDLGLFYPKAQSLDLLSYSDADYAGSRTD
jgi:hypothetical protein